MEFNGIMTKQEGVAVRAVDKHGPLNGSPTKDFSHVREGICGHRLPLEEQLPSLAMICIL